MIILNFYKDGAYIKGHDSMEICNLVSYAIDACIYDCLDVNDDVWHWQSGNYKEWFNLGFSYVKINLNYEGHIKILTRFKENITIWIKNNYKDKVKIIEKLDENIDYQTAFTDAKREQGIES